MRIGVPKERLEGENRVAVTPEIVRELIDAGHEVLFETQAGLLPDEAYAQAGATITHNVYDTELIVKVKGPLPEELNQMHEGQILFAYLHLAANPTLTKGLLEKKVHAIAYETVTKNGHLPLLQPMSQIAGRMAVQAGAISLQMEEGGKGILLGGVPGTLPAKVIILGGGTVGTEAARMAHGLGADVTIFDTSQERLSHLDEQFSFKTRFSSKEAIEQEMISADLVIGAILVPGGKTPSLVPESLIQQMEPGSAIVDVAIDQGGCFETSRPTTHQNPRYITHNIVHYCVTNMPGSVARTGTEALTHATAPYILALANNGLEKALTDDPGLQAGLNISNGKITHPALLCK